MPTGNFAARLPMGGDEAKKDAVVWAAIVLILIPVRIATNVFPWVFFPRAHLRIASDLTHPPLRRLPVRAD